MAAQINPTIGDLDGNTFKILKSLSRARTLKMDIVLFPELTLTGYFPDDLLLDRAFIAAAFHKLELIRGETKGMFVVVGLPRENQSKVDKPLLNSAAVFANGKLLGFQDKVLLPTYDVFDERRYFTPGSSMHIWKHLGKRIGITICEDVWQNAKFVRSYTNYPRDPVLELKKQKVDLLLNISGSPYYFKKPIFRRKVFQKVAQTLKCPVVLCNQVGANDQLVFDGHSLCIDSRGKLLKEAKGFEEDELICNDQEKGRVKKVDDLEDLYRALCLGVRDYFQKQGLKKAVLGLSGGVDSALVACIAKDALGAKNVLALMLPSRYTSKRSVADARMLAKKLKIKYQSVSIEPIFKSYLSLLKPLFGRRKSDITEENLQSRIRAAILMALCNKNGAILLKCGNKSEMAYGYCTLYGDMAGGLAPIQDVTKTRVYELARLLKAIPKSILEREPSAELKENQKDTDTLPPYDVLDSIIEDYIEELLTIEEIAVRRKHQIEFVAGVIKKIHQAEYKRRQAPIGIRVTKKAFSKGRIVPIVQSFR